ncbi:hypothetical protein [Leifsonia sp. 21MFCrub1.1]|uniref:hypothetical protein n=1 Tax=Leifsonia sp. 21MFCrub1.1 TaxID=1798223 RepID=UPI00089281C5|nr:hypothetical protein [Leifsonia sp. 21MFCrub1.1]SEA32884.1 hypothetical protein SAMN04515680_0034 [Leifsonia sp. 21MFCrub1.1]
MTLLALSGCSAGGEGALAKRSTSPGSWSEEVQQAYDKATDAAIKQTLRDGRISDQEYSEMKQRYSDCLKGGGITLKRYDFEGSEYVPPTSMSSDEAHDIESRCSDQSGEYPISYFYVQMRANPTHSNLAQAVVDCFKRRGLVGPGYGLKDYQAGDLPTSNDKAVAACSTDPNGLLGG